MDERVRGFAVLAVGIAATAAWSCLPDIVAATVAPFDAGPTVTVEAVCGDGIIDLDSGEECDPGEGGIGCLPPSDGGGCRVECPDGGLVNPKTHHCYFNAGAERRQDTANDTCRTYGAHLVTFTSEEELRAVGSWAGWPDAGGVWIGLALAGGAEAYTSSAFDEPGWPVAPFTACSGCYAHASDGGDFPPVPLADGGALRGSCVVAAGLAQPWFQLPCEAVDGAVGTICEREPLGASIHPCAGNVDCLDVPQTLGVKRYVYFASPASGDDARADCVSLGGTLFMPDTREERDQIARGLEAVAPADVPLEVWIGATVDANGGASWDDVPLASSPRPSPWGDHEPAPGPGRAFMKLALGKYDTQLCHVGKAAEKRAYLCEIAAH